MTQTTNKPAEGATPETDALVEEIVADACKFPASRWSPDIRWAMKEYARRNALRAEGGEVVGWMDSMDGKLFNECEHEKYGAGDVALTHATGGKA